MAKNDELARILAIIGGIVIVVEGVLGMLNKSVAKIDIAFLNVLGTIVMGIVAIVIGLLVLIS
ncbi:hypothetical protein C5S36_05755, partial [Candidatus Methanophagaceae archaeon]